MPLRLRERICVAFKKRRKTFGISCTLKSFDLIKHHEILNFIQKKCILYKRIFLLIESRCAVNINRVRSIQVNGQVRNSLKKKLYSSTSTEINMDEYHDNIFPILTKNPYIAP